MSKDTGFNKPDFFKDMTLIEVKEIEGDPNVYLIYKSTDPTNPRMIMLKQRHSNRQEFDNYDAADAVINFVKKGEAYE
jgi:hypothetical protein